MQFNLAQFNNFNYTIKSMIHKFDLNLVSFLGEKIPRILKKDHNFLVKFVKKLALRLGTKKLTNSFYPK